MNRHLLLIGFSCTGKTRLAQAAFAGDDIVDSDDAVCEWVSAECGQSIEHIYEIYMLLGRAEALAWIERAEAALIDYWAEASEHKVVSLGPGFPLRATWPRLRAVSRVVLFRRPAEAIYESLRERRQETFRDCPDAKDHDNWDVGVLVDAKRRELPRDEVIGNIRRILNEREPFYMDHDAEVATDQWDAAIEQVRRLRGSLEPD